VDETGILEGLNAQQRRAVSSVRGPLCILAGAGTGKTTTITRRIAAQVASGAFDASEVLAVTFTDKAAAEMRKRLSTLGAGGVRARTFHSAATAQLHYLGREPLGRILATKAQALRRIANSLPKPYRFRPAADLASEIERAKNRRISCEDYLDSLGDHTPPIPADLMNSVYARYERGKREHNLVDFEDLIEMAIRMFERDATAIERLQGRYKAFTVDEYQDVNLLQQSLLDVWLGDRDELCVVGDDYQSIYAFTGASPRYLLEMPDRYPNATVVRLEVNYRSTPQVLDVANKLTPTLGGAAKALCPSLPPGPDPVVKPFARFEDEIRFVVDRIRALHDSERIAYGDMAILYRVNFRSEDYEMALSDVRIPFVVRDGAFLERQAARRIIGRLQHSGAATGVAARVRALAEADGWIPDPPAGLGEREITRQGDLGRLVRLAIDLDDGDMTGRDFVATLRRRFGPEADTGGVNLLTYHRAKGLEFEAVFLPRLQDGELPFRRATHTEGLAEERRLFYVGVTRAKRHLFLTWSMGRSPRSRFLAPLLRAGAAGSGARSPRTPDAGDQTRSRAAAPEDATVGALKSWRLRRARRDGVPPYVILHDRTLQEIARTRPASAAELAGIPGIGPTKLERYGEEILAMLAGG
jgi:DNA helicase-2/ATP-dependent DNA helicase PcrA